MLTLAKTEDRNAENANLNYLPLYIYFIDEINLSQIPNNSHETFVYSSLVEYLLSMDAMQHKLYDFQRQWQEKVGSSSNFPRLSSLSLLTQKISLEIESRETISPERDMLDVTTLDKVSSDFSFFPEDKSSADDLREYKYGGTSAANSKMKKIGKPTINSKTLRDLEKTISNHNWKIKQIKSDALPPNEVIWQGEAEILKL